jgi:hypothetical protein
MKNYKNFITNDVVYFLLESRGISDITIQYHNTIKQDIIKFIYSCKNDNNISYPYYKKLTQFEYSFSNDKFKIDKIYLNIHLNRYKENQTYANIDVKKSKLIDGKLNDCLINIYIYFNDLNDEFIFKINNVILHELVHLYEHYNILINKKFRPYSWSIGSIYNQLRDNYKNKDVLNILHLLYYSLKHEISSQLHQYYDYKLNGKEYSNIFEIINKLKNFKVDIINDNFILELNDIRYHIYNSIKFYSNNKYYIKDLDKSIWNIPIDKNNINYFIDELSSIFIESINYIENKINLINKKSNEIRYDDYDNILTENIINDECKKFEILFFN